MTRVVVSKAASGFAAATETSSHPNIPDEVLREEMEREIVFRLPGVPDKSKEIFALDADLTVYWPWVRPCWEEKGHDSMAEGHTE